MNAALRLTIALGIVPETLPLPLSQVLMLPGGELPPAARETQQLLFEFIKGKTIKDVILEGKDAIAITRAHNGKTKGGTRGEDRKDWPKFIRVELRILSTHLKSWKSYSGSQIESTENHFKVAVEKWPTPVLVSLKKQIGEELKRR
jgi:hypothetical protein